MKSFYRPEIDGLRAIAVTVVILYHAKINILGHQLFKGGFIGVDIFFVISGYLITSIILNELVNTGSFSFKNFYERRIRRILPVLLVVIFASLPFAWMYLLPISFIDFSKSILYSLGFNSNFYFWKMGQTYNADSGLSKPFLHTWSLSVEEQFYILFPFVLFITFKYFRKYLIHFLIFIFFISLIIADWGSRNYLGFNFYVLPTRAWELLAGSILAYFEITRRHKSKHSHTRKNQRLNLILPSLGLLLIVHSILFFNDEMFHPSFSTISPILGVCLIIWFSNKDELITNILSTKLFISIGLISYSLYLWHYPVFAFARIVGFVQGDVFKKLLLGIIILILSIFSYYFIEQPSRNKKIKFKAILVLIVISISILVICNFIIIQKKGFKNRAPEILQKNLTEAPWDLLKNSDDKICHNNIQGCKFNVSSNKKIYIIGDSHASSLMYDLKDKVVKNNYQFITSTIAECLYFPGFNQVKKKTQKVLNECNDRYFQKIRKILSIEKNSIIIFAGRFPYYLSNYVFDNQEGGVERNHVDKKFIPAGKYDTIQKSFKNEVLKISNDNKIILVYPIPEVGWNPSNKIWSQWIKNKFFKDFDLEYITTSYNVYKNRNKSSFELLDSIQGDNIYRVYPHTLFCDTTIKDRCITHDDKNIFYADDSHPFLKGAEMVNDLIMKEIEKIELKLN
jgi:peptidoglycan/LPS O-acetylase OafA/YrhL